MDHASEGGGVKKNHRGSKVKVDKVVQSSTFHHLGIYIYYKNIYKCNIDSIYIYIYLEPICHLFWGLDPQKQGVLYNQNKGHLGSRYVYIYISGWWFQPIWKILVKMTIFPK